MLNHVFNYPDSFVNMHMIERRLMQVGMNNQEWRANEVRRNIVDWRRPSQASGRSNQERRPTNVQYHTPRNFI